MSEVITKRLILKEDVNFDTDGSGGTGSYTKSDGTTGTGYKINASHLPLTTAARAKFGGSTTADGALQELADEVSELQTACALTADKTVTFLTTDTVVQMNAKIAAEKHDLGGHTLTFRFPGSLTHYLDRTLTLNGFMNGVLVQDGNGDTVRDSASLSVGQIGIVHCECKVEIKNFTLMHDLTKYGINLIYSPSVQIDDCSFDGDEDNNSVGIRHEVSMSNITDCTFTDEKSQYEFDDTAYDKTTASLTAAVSTLNTALSTLRSEMTTLLAQNVPQAGMVIGFASSSAPAATSGYLYCDGTAVSRTTYAALFAVIGVLYGAGDGSTTFNLPDFRGRFLRGYQSGVSAAIGTAQSDQNKAHTHDYDGLTNSGYSVESGYSVNYIPDSSKHWHTSSEGGTEARPQNYAVKWYIKY